MTDEVLRRKRRYDGLCRVCGETPRVSTHGMCWPCAHAYRVAQYARSVEGVKLHHKHWTPGQEQLLRDSWGKVAPRDLCRAFGKTYNAIRVRASELGLSAGRSGMRPHLHGNDFGCTCATRTTSRCWSSQDVATLELAWGRSTLVHTIARRLRRSEGAVRSKAQTMGLRRKMKEAA